MKKKSNKNLVSNLACALVFLAALYRCGTEVFSGNFLYAAGWIVVSLLIFWIVLAFKHDKDIPGVGPFGYEDGSNQIARGLYFTTMTSLFVISCIHG